MINDSESIIHKYAEALELMGYTATSIDFLPFTKEKIKFVIISALKTENDEKAKQALVSGYARLATFIPSKDALTIAKLESDMIKKKLGKSEPPFTEDKDLVKKYGEIQHAILNDMEKLIQEVSIYI